MSDSMFKLEVVEKIGGVASADTTLKPIFPSTCPCSFVLNQTVLLSRCHLLLRNKTPGV